MSIQEHQTTNHNTRKTPVWRRTQKKPRRDNKGDYYYILVRHEEDFISFQTQNVGRHGNIQRVAGKRSSGYWSTVKWLIGKADAHVQDNKLIPDSKDAKNVIEQLGSLPIRMLGDRFRAKPRGEMREVARPAPRRTRAENPHVSKVKTTRKRKISTKR